MTNTANKVLYIGVTNNLRKRIWQHKQGFGSEFTSKYNVSKLIYYEVYDDINLAISREKQIKGWLRIKKIKLIQTTNLKFEDLYFKIT